MILQRVSSPEVQAIFSTDLDVQPFILTAALIVTERLTGHYSAERLTHIELWLAAHLASQNDPRVTEMTVDHTTAEYEQAELGKGLDGTRYGQQVRLLDYKGLLSQDMQSRPASFAVE